MKTLKRKWVVLFIAIALIGSVSLVGWLRWRNNPEFTEEKWKNHQDLRIKIVDDYLQNAMIIGKKMKDIEKDLGPPDIKGEGKMEYYLGEDGLGLDMRGLEISVDMHGTITEYRIVQY